MMGAACIMAAINAAGGTELAYVFGGDGATILAPDALAPAIDRALARTRRLAHDEFDLVLRVGAVPLPGIRARGPTCASACSRSAPAAASPCSRAGARPWRTGWSKATTMAPMSCPTRTASGPT